MSGVRPTPGVEATPRSLLSPLPPDSDRVHPPILTLLFFGLPSLCRGQRQARRREAPAAAEAVRTGPGTGGPGQLGCEPPGSWGLGTWPGWGAGRQLIDEGAIKSAGVGKQGHTGASGIPGDHCNKNDRRNYGERIPPMPPFSSPGTRCFTARPTPPPRDMLTGATTV